MGSAHCADGMVMGLSVPEDDTPWLAAIKRAAGRTGAGVESEGMRANTPPSENRPDLWFDPAYIIFTCKPDHANLL